MALQQTQPQNGLTSVEKQINDSNTGQFIQDCDSIHLAASLLYCFTVSGVNVSNYPKEAEKTVLIDFIYSSFGTFRVEEMKTAFKMNAAGKLGEIIEHYQNFSPAYFGKVMGAFRKKSEELKKYQEAARSWNQPVQPLRKTHDGTHISTVTETFQVFRRHGNWQLLYPGIYDFLKSHGKELTFDELATERVKFNRVDKGGSMIRETLESQFKQWCTAVVFNRMINAGIEKFEL